MFKTCFATISAIAMALALLPGTAAAQDAGQFVILNAQYGNDRYHVDVTQRLKELARTDQTFRVNHNTMAADPARGRTKMLRVFARGPNGQERSFDFPDGSLFDGAQFRAWGRGEWGEEHWNGDWNGRHGHEEARHEEGRHDEGQFLILSAQYGSERRHVDVTQQLKGMARTDRQFRVNYRTFGDPDEGHAKSLRVYARGPNGRERMFEYQDGSIIDGAQFRGWGSGEWGGPNDRWSGRWEGEEREEREHR